MSHLTPIRTVVLAACLLTRIAWGAEPADFVGAWAVPDDDGYVLNIVVFGNGATVTTWWEGKNGPRGETGTWRLRKDSIVLSYDSGWTDLIEPQGDGFVKKAYGPGLWIDERPSDVTPVYRVTGDVASFVGMWELAAGAAPTYLALRSNGTAEKSGEPGSLGRWTLSPRGAQVQWRDGPRQELRRKSGGFELTSHRSNDGHDLTTPAVAARRIGEPAPFDTAAAARCPLGPGGDGGC